MYKLGTMQIKSSEDLKNLLRLIADADTMNHAEYNFLLKKAMLLFRNTDIEDTTSKIDIESALNSIDNQLDMSAVQYTKLIKRVSLLLGIETNK